MEELQPEEQELHKYFANLNQNNGKFAPLIQYYSKVHEIRTRNLHIKKLVGEAIKKHKKTLNLSS